MLLVAAVSHSGLSFTDVATWIGVVSGIASLLELLGVFRWLRTKVMRSRRRPGTLFFTRALDGLSVAIAIGLVFFPAFWWKLGLAIALGLTFFTRVIIESKEWRRARREKATPTEDARTLLRQVVPIGNSPGPETKDAGAKVAEDVRQELIADSARRGVVSIAVSNVVGPIMPATPDLKIDAGFYQLEGDRLVFPRLQVTNAGEKPVSLSLRVWQPLRKPVGLAATRANPATEVPFIAAPDSQLEDPLNLAAGAGVVRTAGFVLPNYGDHVRAAIDGDVGRGHVIEVYDHVSEQRFRFSARWPDSLAREPW